MTADLSAAYIEVSLPERKNFPKSRKRKEKIKEKQKYWRQICNHGRTFSYLDFNIDFNYEDQ
jgi:hypothetical protein